MKYTVKPGDTLTSIARQHLGDATRWRELHAHNIVTIGKNPHLIQPGQVLEVPFKLDLWAGLKRIFSGRMT